MSGGFGYTTAAGTTGTPNFAMRYGLPLSLGAGAVIPFGVWAVPASFTVASADGVVQTIAGGWCVSDGTNVHLVAAGQVIPFGV